MEQAESGRKGLRMPDGELLRLARELGNISAACRRLGVDRSAYYRALARSARGVTTNVERGGGGGKSRRLEESVMAVCRTYPDWGCDRIAWYLTLKGESVSSPTIQKLLVRRGLGRAAQRRALASSPGGEARNEGPVAP